MTDPRSVSEERFRDLYAAHGRAILAYAVRRTRDPQDAADVLAETFLVAWRRLGDVPAGDEALLWLYGVARRTLANQARSERRRERLAERLRHELPAAIAAVSAPTADTHSAVLTALRDLEEPDREILILAGWERLEPGEIATVLGITGVAARARLHRARRRLRARLAQDALEPQDAQEPLPLAHQPSFPEEARRA
jgi:RNA polymerase sigma-70 factor, ECF subfamily